MKRHPFDPLSFLAVILLAGTMCLGWAAQAQEQASPSTLDNAKLKTMLVNLGYEPTENTFSSGEAFYKITNKTAELTATISLSLTDPKQLIIFMDFWKVEPSVEIPNDVLFEALTENFSPEFVYFLFLKNDRKFRLQRIYRNKDITPADVRRAIEGLTIVASRTQHIWNPKKWPGAKSAEKPDEPKKAEGQ